MMRARTLRWFIERRTLAPTIASLLVASLAPAVAHAQWRAEAMVAAGRAQLPGHAGEPSPLVGSMGAGAAWHAATRGRWRLELVGEAAHEALADRHGGDARTVARVAWSRDASAGLLIDAGGSLAWRSSSDAPELGASGRRDTVPMPEGPSRQRVRPGTATVHGTTGGVGAWRRARGVLLTASARTTTLGSITEPWQETRYRMVDSLLVRWHFDSVGGGWRADTLGTERVQQPYLASGERVRRLLQTDVSFGASSGRGAFGLALAGGMRRATLGDGGEGWATARATWALRGDVALSLQAARLAADAQRALPGRGEVQLGVLLRPWGHTALPVAVPAAAAPVVRRFATQREADGRVTVTLHAPGARTVELMGDFTAWRIVALERGRGDVWALTLELAHGVHQLNVRVDGGAWLPPPGLGVGDDGFGGTFGLLVL